MTATALLLSNASVGAQTTQLDTLEAISQYVEIVCNKLPLEENNIGFTIFGKAGLGLKGFSKDIISLGLTFENPEKFAQEQLGELLLSNTNCKNKVAERVEKWFFPSLKMTKKARNFYPPGYLYNQADQDASDFPDHKEIKLSDYGDTTIKLVSISNCNEGKLDIQGAHVNRREITIKAGQTIEVEADDYKFTFKNFQFHPHREDKTEPPKICSHVGFSGLASKMQIVGCFH